ncbi:MAG: hypothetical protein J6R35_00380 [Clostridia bacterium]|nr:hypothetical protein [Clostridia bacterium]
MEILKSSKCLARKVALGVLAITIILTSAVLGGVGSVAYADSSSDIGSSGGSIEIDDITAVETTTYSSAQTGRTLKITVPLATEKLYIAYDLDSSENVWAISNGDKDADDVPYIQVTEKVDEHKVTTKTLGEIYSSWSAISVVNEMQVMTVTVHQNGTLWVKAELPGEKALEESTLVDDIDCLAPILESGRLISGIRNENDRAIFVCKASFADLTDSSGRLASARSGLAEILILRTQEALSSETNREDVEGSGIDIVAQWKPLSPYTATIRNVVDFEVDEDGYYYYFIVDRVGNLYIGMFFGGKFQREGQNETDDRFYIKDLSNGITYSIKSVMTNIGVELDQYSDKVNGNIYNNAMAGYSALLLKFYSGASTTDIDAISAEWYRFYNNEYTAFRNAYSIGATYTVNVTNKDLLDGDLTCRNLNKDTIKTLAGDAVVADFIVARYDLQELDSGIATAAGINLGYAYKLTYKLTIEGRVSATPVTNLDYYLTAINDGKIVVVVKTADGYSTPQQIRGLNYVEFYTQLNQAEFYVVYEASENSTNLLPLWITLGVVGGVAVIGVSVYFILLKLNKLPKALMPKKKGAKAVAESEDQTADNAEEPVVTKKANNKSKKGKKKRG